MNGRDDRAHFEPADFVAYHLRSMDLAPDEAGLGKVLILAWVNPEPIVAETGARRAPFGLYGVVSDGDVSMMKAPVGAPATVMVMEEMFAAGVGAFVGVGLCGSLDESLPIGSLVIAGSCHRDEGTSYHYLPPDADVAPTDRAVAALRESAGENLPVVPHWTIDAIYRETRGKIGRRRAQGIRTVDMEASAVYAVARHRGVEAAMLLVVSDELWHDSWRPGFHAERMGPAKERALRTGLGAARALAVQLTGPS